MLLKNLTDAEIFGTRITARSFDIRTLAPGFIVITTLLDDSGVPLPPELRDFPVVIPQQTHSTNVALLNSTLYTLNSTFENTDALISGLRGVAIGVRTADCLPVMIADPTSGLTAAVHAGWRGTVSGILHKTLQEMIRLGADPDSVKLYFGPCICEDCFEIGADVADAFRQAGLGAAVSGSTASLVEANRQQIADLVPAADITLSGLCTLHTRSGINSTLYTPHSTFPYPSWRRDGATASRLLTLILHL